MFLCCVWGLRRPHSACLPAAFFGFVSVRFALCALLSCFIQSVKREIELVNRFAISFAELFFEVFDDFGEELSHLFGAIRIEG